MLKEIKLFLFTSTVLGFLQTEILAMQEFENEGITRKTTILFEKIEELTREVEKLKRKTVPPIQEDEKLKNPFANPQIPIGTIVSFAGAKEPKGWLICDGRTVCSSKYPDLFSVIGKTYTSTVIISPKKESEQILGGDIFCIPDLRGRVVVGVDSDNRKHFVTSNRVTSDNKLGESGGEEKHKLTIDEMPDHQHKGVIQSFNGDGDTLRAYSISNYFSKNGLGNWLDYDCGSETLSEGKNQPHNNMQPYLILNYIIKY